MRSVKTGRMPRLICVFVGHTYHFVGFVMRFCFFYVGPELFCYNICLDDTLWPLHHIIIFLSVHSHIQSSPSPSVIEYHYFSGMQSGENAHQVIPAQPIPVWVLQNTTTVIAVPAPVQVLQKNIFLEQCAI